MKPLHFRPVFPFKYYHGVSNDSPDYPDLFSRVHNDQLAAEEITVLRRKVGDDRRRCSQLKSKRKMTVTEPVQGT
jgi:hypothetical protein